MMDQISDFSSVHVPSPPEDFNFAAHLISLNVGRAAKTAFIDNVGSLSYGEFEARIRRLASGLRDLGVKREERVLLAMQDVSDWPVAFFGAIYAGIVPVAVNTLLTADDYAYMLEHSRAQVVLVSGEVLPALKAALTKADHEVRKVIVSRPVAPLDFGEVGFDAFLEAFAAMARPARTHSDDPAFWLYSSGSTGRSCSPSVLRVCGTPLPEAASVRRKASSCGTSE
jgi:benzoate-CoA ligase